MSENIKRCVDCFHYNACKDWVEGWVGKDSIFPYETTTADEVFCEYFTPTADVAEVVRCKNCKLRDTDGCPFMSWDESGDLMGETQDDDFCSYGERKEQ